MWLRHGVDVWHLDCQLKPEGHDFIASVTRRGSELELYIPPSTRKIFKSCKELNEYLKNIGLEEVNIPE